MRRALKFIGVSFLVGALSLGAAWAGAGLTSAPVDLGAEPPTGASNQVEAAGAQPLKTKMAAGDDPATVMPEPGEILAGASKINIYPQPPEGSRWERDADACATAPPTAPEHVTHVSHAGSPWPENPDCIYSGGFGIGPMNGLTEFDADSGTNPDGREAEGGLWVRSFAIKGSNGKTFSGTIIDGEGWFWDYKSKCDDCGIKQITNQMAEAHADAGLAADGVMIASTHSHAAPDFIGGWGFVPDWYMTQVTNAIKDSISQAILGMEPARLEIGEELARQFNGERRETYRSAEEQELAWMRAIATQGSSTPESKTVFTVGTYAAHPTSRGGGPVAYSDWHGTFAREVERRFGGIGLAFPSGLGNMSSRMGGNGAGLATLIPKVGDGIDVTNTEVRYARTLWAHPATNAPLTALGTLGFFDREFLAEPAQVRVADGCVEFPCHSPAEDPTNPEQYERFGSQSWPCESASPSSVQMNVQALRIGDLALTAAPGEVFSNLTNTLKEHSGAVVTLPIGQANDALGYMPQSFEMAKNPASNQGAGFGVSGPAFIEYEDAYAVDRCLGDMVLEQTIALLGQLRN